MSEIDWTKPIQTRDGRRAKLIHKLTCLEGAQPMVCVITNSSGNEFASTWHQDGRYSDTQCPSQADIINTPPEPVTVEIGEAWVNVYRRDGVVWFAMNGTVPHASAGAAREAAWPKDAYLGPAKLPTTLTVEPAK